VLVVRSLPRQSVQTRRLVKYLQLATREKGWLSVLKIQWRAVLSKDQATLPSHEFSRAGVYSMSLHSMQI
jgi:hypothetical protein